MSKLVTPKYVALMRKEVTTDFCLDIPDLPGCVSYGDTVEAAKKILGSEWTNA